MSKQRRYLSLIGIIAACLGVALTFFALLPPRPGVTKANFDQVQEGMKIGDVENILGESARPFHGFADRGPTFVWQGDDGSLVFVEISGEAVVRKTWRPSTETILDTLRRWLHLPK